MPRARPPGVCVRCGEPAAGGLSRCARHAALEAERVSPERRSAASKKRYARRRARRRCVDCGIGTVGSAPLSGLRVPLQYPRARLACCAGGAAVLHRDRAGQRSRPPGPMRPRPRRRPAGLPGAPHRPGANRLERAPAGPLAHGGAVALPQPEQGAGPKRGRRTGAAEPHPVLPTDATCDPASAPGAS